MAGAQAVTFTATDRQVIKERAGEIDPTKSFKELFFKRDITHKVENEQSTVNPEQDTSALESRRRGVFVTAPREHVEISNGQVEAAIIPPAVVKKQAPPPATDEPSTGKLSKETAALAKELNLNPSDIFDKFSLEQSELHSLIYKIKELHLKRLLCGSREEFERFSDEIKKETLTSGRQEAADWLGSQLDGLTRTSAQYKLNLIKSLQSMHFDDERDKNVRWLEKTIAKYS